MTLRVLLTCKFLPPELEGGGALTVFALARALAREGIDVTVLKARSAKPVDRSGWEGLRIVETHYRDRFDFRDRGLPDFYAQLAAKRFNHRSYRGALQSLYAESKFDVVHAQNHTTALAAASLRDDVATPLAATLRGHGLWCFVLGKALPDGTPCSGCITSNQIPCLGAQTVIWPPTVVPKLVAMKSWMRRQRRLAERIDLMLPISSMMAAEGSVYGRPMRTIPDLVEQTPEGAPAHVPGSVSRALATRREDQRVALYAGRLAPNKGVDLVLQAAERSPGWFFLIAGSDERGDTAARLRDATSRLENVALLGWIPNVEMPGVYDVADVVLLPFLRAEPLSRGMVEALSRGRALAATAHGGPLDAVEDGANGVLFPPTGEGLVEALGRLERADLVAMGHRSRAIYDERFSARRVIDAHLEAYEWLVSSSGDRHE